MPDQDLTEPCFNWSELPSSARSIAALCPQDVIRRVGDLIADRHVASCVWRSDLAAALQGAAHYGNWLSAAGLDPDLFDIRGADGLIPIFLLWMFVDGRSLLPGDMETELEKDAGVAPLRLPVIPSDQGLEMEEVVARRAFLRRHHRHQVCTGLIGLEARKLKALDQATRPAGAVAEPVMAATAHKCIAICQEIGGLYPEQVWPDGPSPEQSAAMMARQTAKAIEARIRAMLD